MARHPSVGKSRPPTGELSRRGFLQAASVAALAWTPVFRAGPGSSRAPLAPPPDFPSGITVYQQAYENWSGEIRIPNVWTAAPREPEEVAELAGWAHAHGWRVRPKGRSHGWSPLLLPGDCTGERCLLVDTTQHLNRVAIDPGGLPGRVTAQTGVTMEALLEQLGAAGLGFAATPAPGDVTLGGVLAINGHGAAVQADGETLLPGKTYGSLSNAVLSLTAVVWDGGRYRLRTFQRDDPGIQPLLAHLGRAFITEATLQAGADVNLRCRSLVHIEAADLFAPPDQAGGDAFQAWVDACGRVEAIWFPFTGRPWLKVWSLAPLRPLLSRRVEAPYAYSFANWVSPAQDQFIEELFSGHPGATPAFQKLELAAAVSGLALTWTLDIWGPSRCTNLYVKPTTLRLAENGYAILCRRADVQRVVSEFYLAFGALIAKYRDRGEYPMNGPVEIRVTGLDQPGEVLLPGALEPTLSALRPWPGRDWDCAVWIDTLTFPGTPGENGFKAELEAWILGNYAGAYAGVRVEWSKGWGYTERGAWTRPGVLDGTIPGSFAGWGEALGALDRYDPGRVFSNPFLDRLMP